MENVYEYRNEVKAKCNINQITAKSNDSEKTGMMTECFQVLLTKGIILVSVNVLPSTKNGLLKNNLIF